MNSNKMSNEDAISSLNILIEQHCKNNQFVEALNIGINAIKNCQELEIENTKLNIYAFELTKAFKNKFEN